MPMRLKDYGRNQKKRKEHIHQSGLLIAGVDVGTAKHKDFRNPRSVLILQHIKFLHGSIYFLYALRSP